MEDVLEKVEIMDVVLYTPTFTYGIVMRIVKGKNPILIAVRNFDLSSEQRWVPISNLIVVGKHPFPNAKGEKR